MPKTSEPIILPGSPESARPATVDGWMSRKGHFYHGPNAEENARYDGSTHRPCSTDGCPEITLKSWLCEACRAATKIEQWREAPKAPWPAHGLVYSDTVNEWFHNVCDVTKPCLRNESKKPPAYPFTSPPHGRDDRCPGKW